MRIDGQLIRAQLEVVAGAVSSLIVGRIWYDKTAEKTKVVNSSGTAKSLVTEDGTQTLTNKTLSGNTATNLISGSGTLTLNTSGTATVPNATDTLVGKATTDTLTNKTFDADGTGNSITNIENADIKAAAAIAVNKLAAVTASRAVVSDASGFITGATTTSTEIGYVNGVTSAIQTQLDAKQARSTLTTKGDLYVATASATVARQAIGSDGQVLTADAAQTNGLKWATPTSAPTQSYELSNLAIAASVGSSALTIALKDSSGSDPSAGSAVKVGFRNATSATGTYSTVSVTSSLSVVVSSGSTLGHSSGNNHYIYVYLINNAGTAELAVSSIMFDDGSIVSTTAEGGAGAADSNRTMYSTTARSNVACRLIGRLKSNQATAGTWASAITEISLWPFEIQAIVAKYQQGSGQNISAGSSLVPNFETKVIDTHNAVTTGVGSWVFTCPRSGPYRVSSNVTILSVADGKMLSMYVRKGGSIDTWLNRISTGVADDHTLGGTTIVSCAAGDNLDIRVDNGDASTRATSSTAAANNVSIEYIGLS